MVAESARRAHERALEGRDRDVHPTRAAEPLQHACAVGRHETEPARDRGCDALEPRGACSERRALGKPGDDLRARSTRLAQRIERGLVAVEERACDPCIVHSDPCPARRAVGRRKEAPLRAVLRDLALRAMRRLVAVERKDELAGRGDDDRERAHAR